MAREISVTIRIKVPDEATWLTVDRLGNIASWSDEPRYDIKKAAWKGNGYHGISRPLTFQKQEWPGFGGKLRIDKGGNDENK